MSMSLFERAKRRWGGPVSICRQCMSFRALESCRSGPGPCRLSRLCPLCFGEIAEAMKIEEDD